MINFTVKHGLKAPKELLIIDDLKFIAERIFIPEMAGNIQQGTAITGGPLPANEAATIKRKKGNRPLIETGRLHRSFTAVPKGKDAVKLTLTGDRKTIGKYLQIDGIKSKSGLKFYKFFGINDSMEKAAVAHCEKIIKQKIKAFNAK
jgi:hypothetical protein